MVEAVIGPLELASPQLFDGSDFSITGTESFSVVCTTEEARQLQGLAGGVSSDTNTPIQLLRGGSPWGPLYIDTSLELDSGSDLPHRGWYLVSDARIVQENLDLATVTLTVEKLSPSEYDYLQMTYTPGVRDGTSLSSGYDGIVSTSLAEDWSDFDTDVWYALATPSSHVPTTPSISSDGSRLTLSGGGPSDGTFGVLYTQTQSRYDPDFVLECDLKVDATPSGYQHGVNLFISPNRLTPGGSWSWNNTLRLGYVGNSAGYSYHVISTSNAGVSSTLVPSTSTTTTPAVSWKLEVDTDGDVVISLDQGSGYVEKYNGPTTLSHVSSLYLGLEFENKDSTIASMSSDALTLYSLDGVANNIIALPVCTPSVGQDFVRESVDGVIPCYVNPTAPLYFGQEAGTIYEGSVEGWNSNYQDSTPRLITGVDVSLTPDEFYFHNGLLKITTSSETTTPVLLSVYAATPGGWSDLQIIDPGPVELVKALYVGPDRQTYQINDTKWTLSRGKQTALVEHPYTALGYTLSNYYVHDSTTTTTPSGDADISMSDLYYTNIYNSTEQYRFQVIQVEPTTIKSDSIPAADITGLGFYDNNAAVGSYNRYDEVAGEFFKQPHQKVNMRTL